MRASLAILTYAASALAQGFEPADFNVTEALLRNGVDASALPKSSELDGQSLWEGCVAACNSLKTIFTSNIVLEDSPGYTNFTNSYWSQQQAEVRPQCIFYPTKALDVSIVVLLSRLTHCPIAAKSGGHAAFAGASSIEGGITISFQNMKGLELSDDSKTVNVQPGNTWRDVYSTLEKDGLAVVGGRVSPIGVGGLTTGGGISFFANQYGWACDNVLSYEVVSASGAIITASPTSHKDLFWALRGGGNNFGLVTAFTLRTLPLGKMWGGSRMLLPAQFSSAIDAFVSLGRSAAQDPKASQILSFVAYNGSKFASVHLTYALPVSNASILSAWNSIPSATDDTRIRSLVELTDSLSEANPYGLRQSYSTATFSLDAGLLDFIAAAWFEETEALADIKDLLAPLTLQTISTPALEAMQKNGANALGLKPEQGPLLLINPGPAWTDARDDERVNRAMTSFLEKVRKEARRKGLDNRYLYMNYASKWQNVIAGYGDSNKARLLETAGKYDPKGIWQRLQPGYFKLDGLLEGSLRVDESDQI